LIEPESIAKFAVTLRHLRDSFRELCMPALVNFDHLRRHAVARSLFAPTSLPAAIKRLGFVQADPIRAPARAQDLMLRHRVKNYFAGDLEQRYDKLGIQEDFFVNYGFLPKATHALMHPRTPRTVWPKSTWAKAHDVLAFVRERGEAHPREVDTHFAHGKVKNWFGGSTNASTQLLDGMHYRGLLRIARRDSGTRVYAARDSTPSELDSGAAMDALVDVIVSLYSPLPLRSLAELINHLRGGAPQWAHLRRDALARAQTRLPSAVVDGVNWLWPEGENPKSKRHAVPDTVRLLAPFDPVVWDRRRFELLWGWAYRFEAYTPAPKRVRGYYALPLLWRDEVIGWGNLTVVEGRLKTDLGYVAGKAPRDADFKRELGAELGRMRLFLKLA
jgi:uncharacterized protein